MVILYIYNITGYYLIVPLVLAISNFILATFNLINNPNNMILRLIQLISLAFIVFIILINVKSLIFGDNLYKFAFIFPFSINKITYLDDIYSNEQPEIYYFRNSYINRFYLMDKNEVADFLFNLNNSKIYLITFEFVISWLQYDEDSPVISLSKPILITKDSNPSLISDFILDKIRLACDNYYLDEEIMDMMTKPEGPGVIVKYSEFRLI
jgi:hypothetical protein